MCDSPEVRSSAAASQVASCNAVRLTAGEFVRENCDRLSTGAIAEAGFACGACAELARATNQPRHEAASRPIAVAPSQDLITANRKGRVRFTILTVLNSTCEGVSCVVVAGQSGCDE